MTTKGEPLTEAEKQEIFGCLEEDEKEFLCETDTNYKEKMALHLSIRVKLDYSEFF